MPVTATMSRKVDNFQRPGRLKSRDYRIYAPIVKREFFIHIRFAGSCLRLDGVKLKGKIAN